MKDALRLELTARNLDQIRTLVVCPSQLNTSMIQGQFNGLEASSVTQPSDFAIKIVNAIRKGKTELITPGYFSAFARFKLPKAISDRGHRALGTGQLPIIPVTNDKYQT